MKQLIISLALLVFLAACNQDTKRFELLGSSDTGITFNNLVEEKDSFNILHNEYMYNGGGVGIGDLNNDGLQDVIFTGNKVSSRVYLNRGHFKFDDITAKFEGLSDNQWYSGVTIVDLNADGWLDVYLTSTTDKDPSKRKNRLWINSGQPDISFTEQSEKYGIAHDGYSVHAGFFDYDLDGDLDLYVLNNIVNQAVPTNYRPKITDGTSANNDRLYRNNGDGTFTDVTIEAGIRYEGFGLGLAFSDVNKDRYPDIYVSNDYISNDILYINQRDGTFKNESETYLSYQSKFSMGNDVSDINNDGNADIMSVDMMPEQYFRKKQTINGNSYFFYINDEKYGYQHQYVRNMIHLHNGFDNGQMLPFSEVGQMLGVFETEWSWSPLFADYDNDGDKDLLLTNGFPKDLTDKDFTNYKAQVYGYVANDQHMLGKIPVVKVSNYGYENTGDYGFKNRTEEWGLKLPAFSNGAAFVDLDNDGDLDYVVNNINDEAFVYRNNTVGKLETPTSFLKIKLEGSGSNTQAIGAKVELWSHGEYQYQEHFLVRGYISSVDPIVHFGLKSNGNIDSVRVIWPSGKTQTILKNVKPNQLLTINETTGVEFRGDLITPSDERLFVPLTSTFSYSHNETDYIDFFQNQRILQHKFSQVGPCIAQGDVNNDGNDDLLVGGSPESAAQAWVSLNGTFVEKSIPGFTDKRGCFESDILFADIDGDKDEDIVSIAGGYANEDASTYQHYVFVNSGKGYEKKLLPLPAFPASVVRNLDVDQDGDEDLFIGARVSRGKFPSSHTSYLLRNENGNFSDTLSFDLGMVTDAAVTDFDQDGWKDIVVTREWNTIALIKNEKGKMTSIDEKSLSEKSGFWSGIVAADLDGDGDEDLVVGNLGENHRFHVSDDTPMRLYAIDVDKNGNIDPITAAYWPDTKGVMTEYPVNYLDELAAQSPFFRKKFVSYTKFSYSSLDSIIDKSSIAPSMIYKVNTTSSYVVWNDNKSFKWERLPSAAQVSPIRRMVVNDFNKDGIKDIIITGNDHSYDVSTGKYDASKGLVLLGAKNKKFQVLLPSQSGLVLHGQVTGLLYYPENGTVVAGINRGNMKMFRLVAGNEKVLASE